MLIARISRLSLSDVRQVAAICFLQVLTACALRYVGLPTLRRGAIGLRRVARSMAGGSEARAIWALEASRRILPGLSTCLTRALVAELVLASPHRSVMLTIGIRRGERARIEAHAWVHRDGRVLVGGPSASAYVPLISWDAPAA